MAESQLPGLAGHNPHDIQPWVVKVMAAMTTLTVVVVALRLASRHIKTRSLWWDDWMILFSTGWYLLVVGFIFAMYANGMGIHADLVEPDKIVLMAKWLVVAEIFYAWNLGWTKLSLLLMYYRIFRIPLMKKMAYAVGIFVMMWVVTITFIFVFICVPVEKLWYPDIPGRCINQVGTWIANAASTIFTDLAILLLPIPQIWKLQLRTAEKLGLTVAFGLGFFVVFASAYRTSVLFTYSSTDPTYTLAPTVGWTAIEISAGIVSACLPTLLPLMRQCTRVLGLSSLVDGLRTHRTGATPGGSRPTGASGSNFRDNLTIGGSAAVGRGEGSVQHLSSNNNDGRGKAFYRLPDDVDSDLEKEAAQSMGSAAPLHLRPDTKAHGGGVNTFASKCDADDDSGDTIPLHSIRVYNEVKQSTRAAF